MKLCELSPDIDADWQGKLATFEALFHYPLGENQRFRIDHSPDHTAFYRAMGDAKTWMVTAGGEIIAMVSMAIRTLSIQGEVKKIAYIGDLKIHPEHQSGRVLFHIMRCLQPFLEQNSACAYSVVMDGTRITPEQYTGRLGIPLFNAVAKLHILRIKTAQGAASDATHIPAQEGRALYERLTHDFCNAGLVALRSAMEPQWFAAGHQACGMLEDTRLAKRLYLTTGEELLSAHLSCFAFQNAPAALSLLHLACEQARQLGYPYMFVALSKEQYALLSPVLQRFHYTHAPATLYATDGMCAHIPVHISEI